MPKKIRATVNYRGTNAYWGFLEASKITIRKSTFGSEASLIIEISGDEGKLSSVRLVIPESLALSWGGVLISTATGATDSAQVNL